jgi:CubicO group peptidase (beta-lactamase class C family)
MSVLISPEKTPEDALPRACRLIDEGMQVGLHVGAQVYVAVGEHIVADFGHGEARPGVLMTSETLMLWMSSGKPVAAAAIMQLRERGLVELDEPVATYLPEFAANGKQEITLWHLLTHTGGFRFVDIGWPESSWNEIIARICKARPERDWIPGEKAGYHPYTSWYVLGEIVRRADGRPFSQYVREEIFLPLGMIDSWIGMPVDLYAAYGERLGIMLEVTRSGLVPHRYTTPEAASQCVPGGNAYGPMHELGRFYHMLEGDGTFEGARVLAPESVALMTSRQRESMFDETFKHRMDWGLGLIIDSNRYGADTVPYGFGLHSSERTFGHGGAQSSLAFCDPENRIVAAVVFNGMPGEPKHNVRMRKFLTAMYEDLGVGSG